DQALLERPASRIVGARVFISLDPARRSTDFLTAQPADSVLFIRRDLVDRRHDRTSSRIGLLAGMDRPGFERVAAVHKALLCAYLADERGGHFRTGYFRTGNRNGNEALPGCGSYSGSPDKKVRTSCLVMTPAGLPSTSTTAAPAALSARAATLTG